jgi:transcriptional regulator with XRE-family HTH domain
MLGLDQSDLAKAANVLQNVIVDFESGKRTPGANDLAAIRHALEAADVEFTNGSEPGVKLRAAKPAISDEAAIGDDPESRGDPYVGSAK